MQKKRVPGNALQLQLLIDADQIKSRLKSMASQLEEHYKKEELMIVVIAKGAFIFVADLVRHLHLPLCLEMVGYSGYRKEERGIEEEARLLQMTGKHVLIIDDVFDTGEALAALVSEIKKRDPASVKSFVLLSKHVPHQTFYRPDFVLFEIEDRFVVGYGLDYKEYYRGLPDIYAIER